MNNWIGGPYRPDNPSSLNAPLSRESVGLPVTYHQFEWRVGRYKTMSAVKDRVKSLVL